MTRILPFSLSNDWSGQTLPLFACPVPAGFPSPADDHLEGSLNLYELLFSHPASTFLARVSGDSMIGAGIRPGDIIAVDRALEPVDGCIVVALVDGEHTLKRLRREAGKVWLEADNERYPALFLSDGSNLVVFGVVTHVIHDFRERKRKTLTQASRSRKRL
jgi:DNA polymerase V